MDKFKIPATIEGVTIVAEQRQSRAWLLAATVFASVEPKSQARAHTAKPALPMSIRAFAALRLKGLSGDDTVARWYRCWEKAIADGIAEPVTPGQVVALPDVDFDAYFQREDVRLSRESTEEMQARVARTVMRDPVKAAEVLEDPQVKEVVVERVAASPTLRQEVHERVYTRQEPITPAMSSVPQRNRDKELADAIASVNGLLREERAGTWTPDGISESMLRLLEIGLRDRHVKAEADIFDQIDAHLASTK